MNKNLQQAREKLDAKLAPARAWYEQREPREQRILQALALLVCTLAIAAVVLMRGELDPTGYEQELTLLQDYLKAEGHPHFLGFLEAWQG